MVGNTVDKLQFFIIYSKELSCTNEINGNFHAIRDKLTILLAYPL